MNVPEVTKKEIISEFNNTLKDLVINIAKMCPVSSASQNLSRYKGILYLFKKSSVPIDIFIQKALIYKEKLDKNDISFLLEESYEDNIDDIYEEDIQNSKRKRLAAKSKQDTIDIIKEVKNVWPTINEPNQETVIAYLKLLCLLAQEYFLLEIL